MNKLLWRQQTGLQGGLIKTCKLQKWDGNAGFTNRIGLSFKNKKGHTNNVP